VLAGADFGAGIWQLTAVGGEQARRVRDHAHDAIAPVWEANHVWLIFVLTVTWTAYPVAFGSIASTLSIPLFLAGLGIILRGGAYTLRSGASSRRESSTIDTIFALSSILTPFALGTMVGAIASRRVPVGNASGDMFSSWLNPTSLLIGVLAVVSCAYLAAVYLCADAVRLREPWLERQFRARALGAGLLAGAVAIGGVVVLSSDATALYDRLTEGAGLAALVVSVLAGVATLALVWSARYEPARYTAAVAVAAIVGGWAVAQQPLLLPELTIRQAAASHDVLVAVTVAVLAGAAILAPSLALLFGLLLGGRFDPSGEDVARREANRPGSPSLHALRRGLAERGALACLLGGLGFLTLAEAGWAHALGIVCLLGFVVLGFAAIAPADLAVPANSSAEGQDASGDLLGGGPGPRPHP
jgi:cytochrome d ubiquinol oxidase subunit II